MEKDTIRTNELESMDLTVVRICNLDIDRNFRGVCEYIDMAVKRLPLSLTSFDSSPDKGSQGR